MAADKHTIRIVDKDGNQSEVTLPGFALDMTQERLIKSVQALGKMNPATAKAYEDLIDATKKAVTATDDASDQQKKDAKNLQNAVQTAGDKQVSALRQFRVNFADRVGRDMRDTFTAGGNILTAAIKTATVGLAAGAGLLYKTFMDTSEAFRSLAQSGLGGAGASGTEAQDAVADLTRLGMSASEAASMLTSFGRASAVLGKANFSKFVSGIASASSFASDLGLTLEEAAEYVADEIDIRQRSLSSQLQLNSINRQAIEESIQQTQRFAGVMGRSMKDINDSRRSFFEENENINLLLQRLPTATAERLNSQLNVAIGAAAALEGPYEQFVKGFVNASAAQIPALDNFGRSVANLGGVAGNTYETMLNYNSRLQAGQDVDPREMVNAINSSLLSISNSDLTILGYRAQAGDEVARMIINARSQLLLNGRALDDAFTTATSALDPMVTAAAALQKQLDLISGVFTTVRNKALGQFADPLRRVLEQFDMSGEELEAFNESRREAIRNNRNLTEEEKTQQLAALENTMRTKTLVQTLSTGLGKIADSFMNKFFPNLNNAGDSVSSFVDMVVLKVDEFLTEIDNFINGLEGDTTSEKIIDAISKGIGLLFEKGVSIVWASIKNIVANHWDSLLGAIGILMTASLAKTAVFAGLSALWNRMSRGAATTASSSITSAGNSLALAIRQVAMAVRRAGAGLGVGGMTGGPGGGRRGPRGGRGMRLGNLAGKASLAGIGASIVGGIASDALYEAGHEKTAAAVDTGSMVLGAAGTGAMIGSFFGGVGAIPGAAIGAAIGGVGALGLGLYQNWNTWFGSDEAEQAIAEAGTEAIEGIDATGMAAMAMDPIHIANVGYALDQFNKVSVDKIAKGLSEFNPKLTELFANIQNVRTQFVDVVSNRIQRLVNILTGLNEQGEKLPTTTEYLTGLAATITSMPIESITRLGDAIGVLTKSLKDFTSLTTSNIFSRGLNALIGSRNDTAEVIKVLNNFAENVKSEELLKAAQATMAFNAGMAGYAAVPEQPTRTPAQTGAQSPADQVNDGMQIQHNNPYKKLEEIAAYLNKIEHHIDIRIDRKLADIVTNTRD